MMKTFRDMCLFKTTLVTSRHVRRQTIFEVFKIYRSSALPLNHVKKRHYESHNKKPNNSDMKMELSFSVSPEDKNKDIYLVQYAKIYVRKHADFGRTPPSVMQRAMDDVLIRGKPVREAPKENNIFRGTLLFFKFNVNFGMNEYLAKDTGAEKEIGSFNGLPGIVGLGNHPFPETRHSVGMKAIDDLATRLDLRWEKSPGRHKGSCCRTVMNVSWNRVSTAAEIILFKPKALMNVNGGQVAKAAESLGVKADKIYLIHDELDLPVGKCALKEGGSARGHKGVQSCIVSLKSSGLWVNESSTNLKVMPRLRLGIGRPLSKSEVVPYVLSPVPFDEWRALGTSINRGLDLLLKHIAMSQVQTESSDQKDDT